MHQDNRDIIFTDEGEEDQGKDEQIQSSLAKISETEIGKFKEDIPVPVITLFGNPVFPGALSPVSITDEDTISAVEQAISSHRFVFATIIKENPKGPKDIESFGTICFIARSGRGPDGIYRVLLFGQARAKIENFVREIPPLLVRVKILEDKKPLIFDPELEAYTREVISMFIEYISLLPIKPPPEFIAFLKSIDIPGKLADIISSNLPIRVREAQDLIETIDQRERMRKLLSILLREKEITKVRSEISKRIGEKIERAQKVRLLHEEMEEIRKEIERLEGQKKDDLEEFREKAQKIPEQARKEVLRQVDRLASIPTESPEYIVIRNWVEEVLALPWTEETEDKLDIKRAKEVLDEDHWDLEDVKDRIIEFLSVGVLKNEIPKGTILCLIGPPGVGKTSLGRSIARALGRKFVRVSLGGVRDEAEIRGHRRTYIGAMPGRIIMGMKQAGSKNPVFMLDEIDKMSFDFRGDPAAALLEVLDPEQNNAFVDHYISVPFDLSKVLFITTANVAENIPGPLLDRMEVIYIPGYTDLDKLNIAKRYFIPKALENTGLKGKYEIEMKDEAILKIIREYTYEAGVRELSRKIDSLFRKIGRNILSGEGIISNGKTEVSADIVGKLLGPPTFINSEEVSGASIGVATGLAWTPAGGDIMKIEAALIPGKSEIHLTGSLGNVMKESAEAGITYARVNAKNLGIDQKKFNNFGIHIHVPEGAVPKDGPSAGVTICVALVSTLSGRPVKQDISMTGEITLRGKILPVGGIREKVLAAYRFGIKEVILPYDNFRDLEKIPQEVKEKMKFHLVKHLDEVWEKVFIKNQKNNNSNKLHKALKKKKSKKR